MDYKLDWTQRARADLREIAAFIGQDSATAALAWGDDLFRHVEVLASFPVIGPVVPQTAFPHTRRIVFGAYLIFYRVRLDLKTVELVTVWHAAPGLPDFL